MTDAAISVEQLGKKYVIAHQRERARYNTLREAMTLKVRDALNGWRGRDGNGSPGEATREEFWALKDVSFEVKRGEVLGIIGRNGAGKSTLLKILSRITEPTQGRVRIRGRVASLLEVGTGFHPELTGRENIYLNGAVLGMAKAEIKRKFDEIVAFSEVEKFLDTPVKRYSSGMYVRLAFAVAAHLEPEILIVDEVLAVGDAEFQKKCLGKMHDVSKGGRTVLFVSHNIAAIMNLCTSGVLLKSGQICKAGDIQTVASAYLEGSRNLSLHNLRDRPDREGAGAIRMTRIWMEGSSGAIVDHAASGEELVIGIEYESVGTESLKNVRVSLAVQNIYEQPLFLCSTELVPTNVPKCARSGVFRCVVPKFPLSGGSYTLAAYFEVDGVVQDWFRNVARIAVEDGDFYNSGKLYPAGWQGQGVLVDHRWEWPEELTPTTS